MSTRDKDNLVFLMSLSPEGFRDWFAQASEDDISYAEALIAQAQIQAVDAFVAHMPQYTQAEEVLKPYML